MTMKHAAKKKKKRSHPSKAPQDGPTDDKQRQQELHRQEQEQQEEGRILDSLMAAFDSFSLEEVASAYKQAGGDPNKAAEFLSCFLDGDTKSEGPDPSSSGSSSSTSGSDFMETGCVQNMVSGRGKQQKRVVASTGTVSTMLGKEYTRAIPKKQSKNKALKEFGAFEREEAEQFLCSMLGDECDLNMAVVKDVLCQCGNNVEKALDVLLDLSGSSCDQSGYMNDNRSSKQDARLFNEQFDDLTDRESECTSHSSEADFMDSIWSLGNGSRKYSTVLTSSEATSPTSPITNVSEIPQKVLESLFNMSKSHEHDPGTMNWRSVVKKMQLLGPGFDACSSSAADPPPQDSYAKGDEYNAFRKTAKAHWESMRNSYQKASEAHSKGKWGYAAYLSDQGKKQTKMAQVADEKASLDIFKTRNKDFENVITIDLHGQHLKQAMKLLKLHLLFGTYVPSIRTLRVITGCGSHGVGKSVLKQSVVKLLATEGVEWSEENRGTLLIKMDGYREFAFLDTDSDTE